MNADKLTRADFTLLEALDYTPRVVPGDFSRLIARAYVERHESEFVNRVMYSLTADGARLRRWWCNR